MITRYVVVHLLYFISIIDNIPTWFIIHLHINLRVQKWHWHVYLRPENACVINSSVCCSVIGFLLFMYFFTILFRSRTLVSPARKYELPCIYFHRDDILFYLRPRLMLHVAPLTRGKIYIKKTPMPHCMHRSKIYLTKKNVYIINC